MAYLRFYKFGKWETCPTTETLLRFISEGLTANQHEKIATHIAVCDFCGAEIQLLSKNPSPHVAPFQRAEMPPHLQSLAASFLTKSRKKQPE